MIYLSLQWQQKKQLTDIGIFTLLEFSTYFVDYSFVWIRWHKNSFLANNCISNVRYFMLACKRQSKATFCNAIFSIETQWAGKRSTMFNWIGAVVLFSQFWQSQTMTMQKFLLSCKTLNLFAIFAVLLIYLWFPEKIGIICKNNNGFCLLYGW